MQLNSEAQQWIIGNTGLGSDAAIESVAPLLGGTSSVMLSITVGSHSLQKQVVLRLLTKEEWLREEPDLAAHEAASLRVAARAGVQSPTLLAYDETGRHCGYPAVLMTHLKGEVDLRPGSMQAWLDGLAKSLALIHTVEVESHPWAYFTYNNVADLQIPDWSRVPDQWQAAIHVLQGPQPTTPKCFVHRDYHPTNVLWHEGRVSGVVDWINACMGPAGIDVGHCRLNLALLYGVETADDFLHAYLNASGTRFQYDVYWDLLSLIEFLPGPPTVFPGWVALGIDHLTDEIVTSRMDDYATSLVARLHTNGGS